MAIDTELDWYGDIKKKAVNIATIKALTRSSNLVQADAKSKVPVDTGNLKVSIVTPVKKAELIATDSPNIEYAPYVEFGLRSNPSYPKQPYMRPALNENIKNIKKIFIDEEEKAIGDK